MVSSFYALRKHYDFFFIKQHFNSDVYVLCFLWKKIAIIHWHKIYLQRSG